MFGLLEAGLSNVLPSRVVRGYGEVPLAPGARRFLWRLPPSHPQPDMGCLAELAHTPSVDGERVGVTGRTVVIADKQPPVSYRLTVEARGRSGFVKGESMMKIAGPEFAPASW